MTDHQNCTAWNCKTGNYKTGNCRTWKWRTKNDARARAWNGMLNLYSVYSASNVRRLCALLCPAISFLHFHVLQFHVLHIGPSISRPSFSRPAFSAPPNSYPGLFYEDLPHLYNYGFDLKKWQRRWVWDIIPLNIYPPDISLWKPFFGGPAVSGGGEMSGWYISRAKMPYTCSGVVRNLRFEAQKAEIRGRSQISLPDSLGVWRWAISSPACHNARTADAFLTH